MRKLSLLIVFTSLLFTSCVVKETLTFNQNNSGKLAYEINMSKMMEMAGDKMGGDSKKKSKKKNDASKDIDSTFSFKELYADKKDSIAKLPKEEQERLKKMERYSGRIIMNEEKKKMEIHFFTDFNNPSELQELVSPVNALSSMNPSGAQMGDETPKNDGETTYKFDGKKFTKMVKVNAGEELKKGLEAIKESASEEEEDDFSNDMSETFKMMYDQSSYEMTVNFPKKIKKVSIPNAKISADGKSVTILFAMANYMESKDMNFDVELE